MKLNRDGRHAMIGRLATMPGFLESSFGALSAVDAARLGRERTLSPVEQCWHLADLEREGYGARIRRLLNESNPVLPDFNGARMARERQYVRRRLREALDAFRDARADNLTALRRAQVGDWLRAGVQGGIGRVALCDIPAMMDEHDEIHRREIGTWLREHRSFER
jgi:hypothetical protein